MKYLLGMICHHDNLSSQRVYSFLEKRKITSELFVRHVITRNDVIANNNDDERTEENKVVFLPTRQFFCFRNKKMKI
jgi:hypothetical protein